MRILLINKYYYLKGGAERYVFILSKLLKQQGHQVAIFAMDHPYNLTTKWSKYFVSYVNLKKPSQTGRLKTLSRLFYSREAGQKISQLIQDFKPDIAHVHNIYGHISPSILITLKNHRIPIVQTVHDYHLIHPSPNMFHDGHICQITRKSPFLSIFHNCLDPNPIYSIPPTLAFAIHRSFGLYQKNIAHYIAPSRFMKKIMVEHGFPSQKITYLPNPVNFPRVQNKNKGEYVLYFGQLVEHKGILSIINAARHLPHLHFVVAGDGPLKNFITSQAIPNLTLKNHLKGQKLINLITHARCILLPAIWYENQPYSIMEALAYGKPIITTKIGGIPELIHHQQNGLLIKPGDDQALIDSIDQLWHDHQLRSKLTKNAMQSSHAFMTDRSHYRALTAIYQQTITAS